MAAISWSKQEFSILDIDCSFVILKKITNGYRLQCGSYEFLRVFITHFVLLLYCIVLLYEEPEQQVSIALVVKMAGSDVDLHKLIYFLGSFNIRIQGL